MFQVIKMSEYKYTPEEAVTFRIPADAEIPPSAWEQEYWDTVKDMQEEHLVNIFDRTVHENQLNPSEDEGKKKWGGYYDA